ncbi:MAG: DUF4332 domain-containing protein, partial [Gemmatimonadota bacterium]|nr:DUF4332 domain-containing protein [Gemmatimonadota bacterium]
GQWIYTVPWLEYVKVFEMPPLGFLGFPFFALEAWALYHLLCSLGLATPAVAGTNLPRSHWGRLASWLAAGVFVVAALAGMERWTISSTTPRLRDAPDLTAAEVQQLREGGYSSVFRLAAAAAPTVAEQASFEPSVATQATDWARLATLRGIGSDHAQTLATVGVRTVCSLARRMPGDLWNTLRAAQEHRRDGQSPVRPVPAEVRIWIAAARRECTDRYAVPISSAIIHEAH